jgi:hypothetical protein
MHESRCGGHVTVPADRTTDEAAVLVVGSAHEAEIAHPRIEVREVWEDRQRIGVRHAEPERQRRAERIDRGIGELTLDRRVRRFTSRSRYCVHDQRVAVNAETVRGNDGKNQILQLIAPHR